MDFTEIDREDFSGLLEEIGRTNMPFGRYGPSKYPPRGVPVFDLPAEYLAWFAKKGFPKGRLGELLATVFEIKECGADEVFQPLRDGKGGRFRLSRKAFRLFDFGTNSEEE